MCSWAYSLEAGDYAGEYPFFASFGCVEGFSSASGEHVSPSSLSVPGLLYAQSGTKFGLEVTFHNTRDTWIFMDMGCTSEYTERINTSLASLLLRGCCGWEAKCVWAAAGDNQEFRAPGLQWAQGLHCWWAVDAQLHRIGRCDLPSSWQNSAVRRWWGTQQVCV